MLVDVVVRDRRGQPVKDLTQADFEILEDGVAQTIGSFTPILERVLGSTLAPAAAPAAPAGNAAAPASTPAIAAGPGVTAIVFHGLSPEGRKRAVESAQAYLGQKEEMSNYVGIFGIDLSLVPLVPFTRNGYAVRQALNRMATGSSAGFNAPEMQQQRTNAENAAASATAAANSATGAAGAGNSGNVGTAAGDAKLAQMEASIVSGFQAMERNQSGYIATDALVAIVRTLGRVPGRKSVVLFSEGLEIPTDVARLFSGVMDAANRANVSIYTIDAAGLRAQSEQQKVRDMVVGAGGASEGGYSAEGGGGSYTRGILEANENALRDPTTLLKQLAIETGGQSFNNTNNLKPAFERVDSDLHNYYMLGYTPINTAFDGKFRTIQVKVKRSGLTIAARKGYFAVRNPGTSPVNDWEAPALGALEQKPVPNAFPVRAGALLFPERGRPGLVPVVVEVKTEPLTFQPDKDGKSYTSDFTVLVRFLDRNNQVARKLSEHYQIRGDSRRSIAPNRVKSSSIVSPSCRAGVYSMETVVHDAPSGKSSVRFATVEVPRHRGQQAPHEQSGSREARRERPGEGSAGRQSAARQRRRAFAQSRGSRQQGIEGSDVLLRDVSGQGRKRAERRHRAAPERQAGGAAADAGSARRRERPHPAAGTAAHRSTGARHLRAASHRQAGRSTGRPFNDAPNSRLNWNWKLGTGN